MINFITEPKPKTSALIEEAKQAYEWSGVLPTSCWPGVGPISQGALSQTQSQMLRDCKRNKNGLVGLPSAPKGLAILVRKVLVGEDYPSQLAERFFDPDTFLVTRTKTINLRDGRIALNETVVVKSPFDFPCGMKTNDPSIVVAPNHSWALFATKGERVIAFRRSGVIVSIQQLNGGTFTNREIMDPSSYDWAILQGGAPL
jgi:hypothetical protein